MKKLLSLLLFSFSIHSTIAQIYIDSKTLNIKEIDVRDLAGLLGADTLPYSFTPNPNKNKPKWVSLVNVTIKPWWDERGGAFVPTLYIPKTIKSFNLSNCKTERTGIQIELLGSCDIYLKKINDDFFINSGYYKPDSIYIDLEESSIRGISNYKTPFLQIEISRNSKVNSIDISFCGVDYFSIRQSEINKLSFEKTSFYPKKELENIPEGKSFTSIYSNIIYLDFEISKASINNLLFNSCKNLVQADDSHAYFINIEESEIKSMSLIDTDFDHLNLRSTTISKSLVTENSSIKALGVLELDVPQNFNLPFNTLLGEKLFLSSIKILEDNKEPLKNTQGSDSISIEYFGSAEEETLDTVRSYYSITRPYKADTSINLLKKNLYDELINAYTKFYTVYKTRGDTESANLCYIEMKRIEGRRLQALYKQSPSLERYFAFELNRFLEWFCDYGTNPVKSLVYAVYVIALFGFLYFLFPSEADNLSRKNVFSFFDKAVDYFKTDKQLTQLHQEEKQHEIEALEKFSATIQQSKGSVPPIVWYLGAPLYKLGITYNRLIIWALGKSDLVKGRWENLSRSKKIRLGTLITIYFIGFLLFGLFMRLINALALSLNAFVTLGYGEISAKGVARYLAVLEGVVGWFLLSIFSVSLISQILS